jgi:hypothetical protein
MQPLSKLSVSEWGELTPIFNASINGIFPRDERFSMGFGLLIIGWRELATD